MPSIFLSHSSIDKPFARRLAFRLEKAGLKVWIDEAEINVGDSLLQKLSDAIDDVDYVGAVISQDSSNSEWVRKELQLAMAREIASSSRIVLPIVIDNSPLPSFLVDKFYADFRNEEDFNESFLKILRAVDSDVIMDIEAHSSLRFTRRSFARRRSIIEYVEFQKSRVMIYWHNSGLTKDDALRITGVLASQGILSNLMEHKDARPPDAIFINQRASVFVVRSILQAMTTMPEYIYPYEYDDPESGSISEYMVSIGLHSDFHLPTEDPKKLPRRIPLEALNALIDANTDDQMCAVILANYCRSKA